MEPNSLSADGKKLFFQDVRQVRLAVPGLKLVDDGGGEAGADPQCWTAVHEMSLPFALSGVYAVFPVSSCPRA